MAKQKTTEPTAAEAKIPAFTIRADDPRGMEMILAVHRAGIPGLELEAIVREFELFGER